MDDSLGDKVDQFNKLVVVEANKQNNQQRQDAAKGRDAEAKEVRVNVVAKDRGVSEEANRLCMLSFSLTKYSTTFAEVKGYFGNNNQLGNVEIPASVKNWSKLCSL